MEFTIGHWLAVYYALVGVGGLGWLVCVWRARREWWKRRGVKVPEKGIDTSHGAFIELVRRTSSDLRQPSPGPAGRPLPSNGQGVSPQGGEGGELGGVGRAGGPAAIGAGLDDDKLRGVERQ